MNEPSLLLSGDNAGDLLADPNLIGALPEEDRLRLNRELDERVARINQTHADRMREQETRLRTESDQRLALAQSEADRQRVASVIDAHRAGIPDEGVLNLKAREKLQDLHLSALTGTDEQKDGAWHLTTAAEIVRLHQEERRAAGGDGAQVLPDMGLGDAVPGSPWGRGYNPDRMMLTLYDQVREQGERFSAESFTGCPEAEMVKDILKQPFAAEQYAQLTREAKPGHRVIPVPAAVLSNERLQLGETYAEAVATATAAAEPDYRRDLLVHHFRPIDRLMFLGVMQETISNNITYSRVTGAPKAAWVAENARRGRDAAHPREQDHEPEAANDLRRGVVDAARRRGPRLRRHPARDPGAHARVPAGARDGVLRRGETPTARPGLGGISGVLAGVIGGSDGNTDPTYADVLNMLVDIADADIQSTCCGGCSRGRRPRSSHGSSPSRARARWSPSRSTARPTSASAWARSANFPAACTSQVPTDLNSGAETADDEHAIIAGVWPYLMVLDYATMFITIDDISLAIAGKTRLTVNSYHDIGGRVPPAFSFGEFKP